MFFRSLSRAPIFVGTANSKVRTYFSEGNTAKYTSLCNVTIAKHNHISIVYQNLWLPDFCILATCDLLRATIQNSNKY